MAVRFETDGEPIPGYKLLDRLGSGGFGEVWRCEAPGGIFKAVKVIFGDMRNRETDAYRFAEQELKSLKRVQLVRHPYLLALDRYDIVEGRLVIVMELADCNLWDRYHQCRKQGLPGIPRDELMQYMFETAEVLDLMDGKYQLQHLDIKPQNLFLLYNHVKVADFGQVKDLEGLVAQVTGGITPVYAAPETFDGFVSRYCDQYSLACVYQELLTGIRPFDGTSMQQLLMQHLQAPPNLGPSPHYDRAALAKALSKRPEDRFPNVMSLVKALRDGGNGSQSVAVAQQSRAEVAVPAGTSGGLLTKNLAGVDDSYVGGSSAVYFDSGSNLSGDQTSPPRGLSETNPPLDRPASPVQTGPGPIRPALIIGIGYTGLRVVQHLQKQLNDRYGEFQELPAIRILYLDTNAETMESATQPATERELAPLKPDCVLPLKLNRAAHYLKPRSNGRPVIEGWFDNQLLYKFSRMPNTMGLRQLGRLAFADHYRVVMLKIQAELDACITPEALAETINMTGQDLRTNRPRVYVIAGLGGGTGGGFALDLGYAIKSRLRRLGYAQADVIGLLLAPADATPTSVNPTALANTYAVLTELNHYSNPETTYSASFDESRGTIVDSDGPFTKTYILPGLAYPNPTGTNPPGSLSGVRTIPQKREGRSSTITATTPPSAMNLEPIARVADFLRVDLLTQVGPVREESHQAASSKQSFCTIRTFGLRRFGWPRAAIVKRTARIIAPVLLTHWVSPDRSLLQTVVPRWVNQLQNSIGLTPDLLGNRLRAAADLAAGGRVEEMIAQVTESLTPKSWLSRAPEPDKISVAVDWLTKLIGPPRESVIRSQSPVEEALKAEAAKAIHEFKNAFSTVIPTLLDDAEFRLAGTEEAIRRLLILIEKSTAALDALIPKQETAAGVAYDRLAQAIYPHKGVKKVTAQEIGDATREYPLNWYEVLVNTRLLEIYEQLHNSLMLRLNDLTACRNRIEEFRHELIADAERPAGFPAENEVLPVGCGTTEDAAQRFLQVLNDDDLTELEARVQKGIASEFGGVYEACLNSTEGPDALLRIMRRSTREYLDQRLGEVDLAGMMKQKFGSSQALRSALHHTYEEAEPKLTGKGPWASSEQVTFSAPEGAGGEPIINHATEFLPPSAFATFTPDETVIYREYTDVPLQSLTQLGPAWNAAYASAHDLFQTSVHCRVDITRWIDVDSA